MLVLRGGEETVHAEAVPFLGGGPHRFAAVRGHSGGGEDFIAVRAGDLAATYHFVFTGAEPAEATVVIREGTIKVAPGLIGTPDLHLVADSATWVRFARKESPLILALFGWLFLFATTDPFVIVFGLALLAVGAVAFLVWSRQSRRWPFDVPGSQEPQGRQIGD